jgi:SAM-dependent methyltransferase
MSFTMGKAARVMKNLVNGLGEHPWAQKPFFWAGFFTVRLMFPVQYLVLRELIGCESVLDLGCGRHSMVPILPRRIRTVGVEFFKPHLEEAMAKGRHQDYIHADITKVDFENKSFDAVVLLDVIERRMVSCLKKNWVKIL